MQRQPHLPEQPAGGEAFVLAHGTLREWLLKECTGKGAEFGIDIRSRAFFGRVIKGLLISFLKPKILIKDALIGGTCFELGSRVFFRRFAILFKCFMRFEKFFGEF